MRLRLNSILAKHCNGRIELVHITEKLPFLAEYDKEIIAAHYSKKLASPYKSMPLDEAKVMRNMVRD